MHKTTDDTLIHKDQETPTLEVTLKDFAPRNLNQSSQQVAIQFAYLSKNNEQCHQFVLCRDYLHDIMYSILGKKPVDVYGFYYSLDKNPQIDLDSIKLMVMFPHSYSTKKIETFCKGSLRLLNHYETLGTFDSLTKVYNTSYKDTSDPYLKVFVGPNEWLKAPALISMFTMLIRLGYHNFFFNNDKELAEVYEKFATTGPSSNDRGYVTRVKKYLSTVVVARKKLFMLEEEPDGYFKEYKNDKIESGTYHNYRGIQSLCMGSYLTPGTTITPSMLEECYNITQKGVGNDKSIG